MLQQLFAKFDRDSTRLGLYKLCTIGDAYVAVSEPVTGAADENLAVDAAEHVLEMAHAMIANIHLVRERLAVSLGHRSNNHQRHAATCSNLQQYAAICSNLQQYAAICREWLLFTAQADVYSIGCHTCDSAAFISWLFLSFCIRCYSYTIIKLRSFYVL